ncbi:MAG: imidazole glycerol phosphate synthase subunit HisF, partial [Chitinophagales bacterium]
ITASHERRRTVVDLAARTAEEVFIPFTVGGGISDLETIRDILKAGADKISLNTAALSDPELITRGAVKFGAQCIVVAVDVRRVPSATPEAPAWEVYVHGGRTPTGRDALGWIAEAERRGAGEILLTSMDADGTQGGYDLELLRRVSERTSIPVIASGGAGEPAHLAAAIKEGGADAVLAASIFHYGTYTVRGVKEYLRAQGIPVRL